MTEPQTITAIPLDKIDPSPYQTRRFTNGAADLEDLATSIQAVGVLHPVLVRPGKKGRYELLAGERRTRAAKLAGMKEIPGIVKDLDDDTACEVCVTENLQREHLHPLDEAAGIALLQERLTHDEIAARLGRSVSFVARRSRLTTLSENWRNAILLEGGHLDLSGWGVTHLEAVARIAPEDQDRFLDGLSPHWAGDMTAAEIQREIASMLNVLGSAPFDTEDGTLLEDVPACGLCPLRASANPGLFDEGDEEDRCLSAACWSRKVEAHGMRAVAKLAGETGEEVTRLTQDWRRNDRDESLTYYSNVSRRETPAEGFTPAVMMDGPDAGKVLYVKPWESNSSSKTKKGPKTLAEKQEGLRRRRLKLAIKNTLEAVREAQRIPETSALLEMAAAIGTKHQYYHQPGSLAASWMSTEEGAPAGTLAGILDRHTNAPHVEYLWRVQLLKVIESRNAYQPGIDIEASWTEVSAVAQLVNVEAEPFLEAATEAIKEPKAWAKAA